MSLISRLIVGAEVAMALVLPALARTGQLPSQAPPLPRTGSISGTVIEAGTNAPIGDAVVTLIGPPDPAFRPTGSGTGVTDDSGQFVFRNLAKGAFRLRVEADGFVPGLLGQDRGEQVERVEDAPLVRTLELADGEGVTGLTIAMSRKAGVGGFVGDDFGDPVVGARVSVIARAVGWTGVRMRVSATVTTDDRGLYHADVMPGDYIVGVLAATTTATAGWNAGADIKYLGTPDASNAARIGDRRVSSLPGRSDAAPPRGGADGQVWTCPTTFYPFGSSPAQARVLTLKSGEERTNVDLALAPQTTRRVSGRIESTGGSPGGTQLELILNDSISSRVGAVTALEMALSSADQSGAFSFVGIPPGDYTLRARHMNASGGIADWAVERVFVPNADVTNVLATLRPAAPLEGTLSFVRSGATTPSGASPSVTIAAIPLAESPGALSPSSASALANPMKPLFSLSVVPGPYVFSVSTPASWYTKSITVDGVDALDQPFTIKPSGARDVLVTITDSAASISGVARARDGSLAPFAAVAAFPADRTWVNIPGSRSQRLRVVPAGRTGFFRIAGLPPGDYWLIATAGSTPDFQDPGVRGSLIASAARVILRDADVATRDAPVVVIK